MKNLEDFYWAKFDVSNKDTQLVRKFGQDVWDYKQHMIDKLQEEVNRERKEATEYFIELEYANTKCKELQKRIDDLKNWCVRGVECNMLSTEYNQALIDMIKILKGGSNEN